MIVPTVHLNGTSASALTGQYEMAGHALRTAIQELENCNPNARDYYVQGPDAYRLAAAEHNARIQKVRDVLKEIEELHKKVTEQEEARRR